MANFDTVVFDVGNVLVDWSPHYLFRAFYPDDAAIDRFLAEVDFHVWNREQDRGADMSAAVAGLARRHPGHAAAILAYDHRFQETIRGAIDGTVAVLERLVAAGLPVHAITNFNQRTFRQTQARFPFLTRFRDVVVSGEERLLKPDPAIYRVLLARNNLEAGRCVFIDDVAANIAGAEAVGMRGVHFTEAAALGPALARLGIPV